MPTNTFRPRSLTITPEVRVIRRLIRRTHFDIRHGTIDPLQGTRTIARLTESLATLLRVQHVINPPNSKHDQAYEVLDRLLRAWPSDLPLPDRDPTDP
jgi:hypothetical protein